MRQPPEKVDTGCSHLLGLEAQAEQQRLGARARGVHVRVGQRRVQLAHARAVIGSSRKLCSSSRSAVSPSIAYSTAGRSSGGRLLRDVRDAPVPRQVDVALVGVQLVAQQREQARLARAVGADQAGVLARVEGQVGLLEEQLRAAPEADLRETNHVRAAEKPAILPYTDISRIGANNPTMPKMIR